MPHRSAPGVRDVFFWSLLFPAVVSSALHEQPHYNAHNQAQADGLSKRAASAAYPWKAPDSLNPASSEQKKHHDAYVDNEYQRFRSTNSVSALATVSPAESHPAVRAPPATRSTSTAGLSTRQTARSLQDWQVEDIVLLATVDGNIHAHDRNTGAEKWQIKDRPMIETIYHAHNKSTDEHGVEQEDYLWIVEPSQDGSIYMYSPGSQGIQKLGLTVKQLVNESPLRAPGKPSFAYTATKKSMLYTIDAATGEIIFSSIGSDQSCKRVNPLESLEDEECERIGELTLGRVVYTIDVQDGFSGEQISTIKYSEWVQNNNDHDLRNQHSKAMDSKYIYTGHDGMIYGLDFSTDIVAKYSRKLASPVARVFDLVRRQGDTSEDASLVVLPQPLAPPLRDVSNVNSNTEKRVFVDYTAEGSWYALSESNYPTVTDRAFDAKGSGSDFYGMPYSTWPIMSEKQRKDFAGVHVLAQPSTDTSRGYLVEGTEYLTINPPPGDELPEVARLKPPLVDSSPSLRSIILAVLLCLVTCGLLYQQQLLRTQKKLTLSPATDGSMNAVPEVITREEPSEDPIPMVREAEPAKETIFPHEQDGGRENPEEEREQADDDYDKIEINEALEGNEQRDYNPADTKPKKKATRGKRGGKKQKEKEQQQAEARAKRANSQSNATEVITVAASESPQVAGPLQINSLLVHTDKVIGQGSCGTCVFEGSFEGRDVAVKRMLSQYYELASQEVSFLQQSDDHSNVVRYFCQQKDDHFLYIAVELCQASVFEVWEAEKAKTDARQMQLRSLKHAIQQNVPLALHQLAAGLYHLHNLRIIHRDIKPQNILVAYPKRNQNQGPRLVISDFGLGKNLPENVSTLVDPTGNAGTSGWKAPELISQPRDSESKHSQSNSHTGGSENVNGSTSGVKRAADIFSLGCLFFWVLTDGTHPYEDENGWQQLRELNIKRDNKKMGVLERWSDAYEPMQLISSMLEHQPENRPTALQVLHHPFFWSAEKRLSFLCDCSDHFEREQRGVVDDGYMGDSWHLHLLECRAQEVIGAPFDRADFLSKLDRHFVDTLGKQRKYSGNRLLDLLRALRNKKNHYEDMPEDVKRRVGPLAGGYLNYWSSRFPRLLMACYEVVREAELETSDRFKGYFTM